MYLTVNTCNSSCFYSLFIFLSFFFFRYEWSKFVFISSPRTFCTLNRVRGGTGVAWVPQRPEAIVHTYLRKIAPAAARVCFLFIYFFNSQTIRLHSLVFPHQCAAHTLPVVTLNVKFLIEFWELTSCKLLFLLPNEAEVWDSLNIPTWLAATLEPLLETQTQTSTVSVALSAVNYCLMGSSVCSSPLSCFENTSN